MVALCLIKSENDFVPAAGVGVPLFESAHHTLHSKSIRCVGAAFSWGVQLIVVPGSGSAPVQLLAELPGSRKAAVQLLAEPSSRSAPVQLLAEAGSMSAPVQLLSELPGSRSAAVQMLAEPGSRSAAALSWLLAHPGARSAPALCDFSNWSWTEKIMASLVLISYSKKMFTFTIFLL